VFIKWEAFREVLTETRSWDLQTKYIRQLRFIKFPHTIICLLYLFKNLDKSDLFITDPILGVTNRHDWFKIRALLNNELRQEIKKFNPRGQRTDKVPL